MFFFVNKKEPKKLFQLVEILPVRLRSPGIVGSQARRRRCRFVPKFFWFFLFTKRTRIILPLIKMP